MCGRVDIHTPPAQLARALEAQLAAGVDPDGRPSWNVGPTRAIPAVVRAEGHQVLDLFRWGLVPHWAKNPKVGGYKMINARAETAGSSNAYKGALKARRCLVVVDGFYEWAVANPEEPKTSKVPFYFKRSDGNPITFAGLYETWWDKSRAKEAGEPDPESYMQTCVIVTTEAGPDMAGVHDRMPVIIEPGPDRERWLDPAVQDPGAVADLLKPAPAGTLVRHPVSTEVNNTRRDGPELTQPDPEVDADLFLVPGITETD